MAPSLLRHASAGKLTRLLVEVNSTSPATGNKGRMIRKVTQKVHQRGSVKLLHGGKPIRTYCTQNNVQYESHTVYTIYNMD